MTKLEKLKSYYPIEKELLKDFLKEFIEEKFIKGGFIKTTTFYKYVKDSLWFLDKKRIYEAVEDLGYQKIQCYGFGLCFKGIDEFVPGKMEKEKRNRDILKNFINDHMYKNTFLTMPTFQMHEIIKKFIDPTLTEKECKILMMSIGFTKKQSHYFGYGYHGINIIPFKCFTGSAKQRLIISDFKSDPQLYKEIIMRSPMIFEYEYKEMTGLETLF
jgi:hypothetical protein